MPVPVDLEASAPESHEFSGRVALVTGSAGSGIGQATARRLAAGGATVVVTDVHERRTHEVTSAIAADHPGATVVGFVLDAGDSARIDDVTAAVFRSVGPVQILVNNAAVNIPGGIFDSRIEDWERCVAVNLTGPWALCRAVMPQMRDAGGGVIVNVGTYAPEVGGNGRETPYAVTKGGLNALTRACAVEGGPHGIRSVGVSMGVVSGTKIFDDNPGISERNPPGPLGRYAIPEEIAEAIAFLASDRSAMVTGETLNVAGGAYFRS